MPLFECESTDQKQHLNLSEEAFSIMESDMFTFNVDKRSTFLNHVFESYYEEAEASISIRIEERECYLETILEKISNKKKVIESLVLDYKKQLIQRAENYPKGLGLKFRISNENFSYLTENVSYHEEKYFRRIGQYFKAIIEEYARKPYRDRERIYYAGIFNTIEEAIKLKRQVSAVFSQGVRHSISPYKIEINPLSTYHYLIGKEIIEDALSESKVSFFSYRITNISDIKLMKSKSCNFKKEEIEQIKNEILKKGVQFLSSECSEILVEFTPDGLKKYKKMLHLRPTYSRICDEYVYAFNCTESQAEFYFFRFGEDVKIIKPLSLAQRFEQLYSNAARKYAQS